MDQTRKRRIFHRKAGLSCVKVLKAEVPEEDADSRDLSVYRASSPQWFRSSQEPDDSEQNLIIKCETEQGGIRTPGQRKGSRRRRDIVSDAQHKKAEDDVQPEVEIDQELDRELENKSRQHNLTSANVRSIIHEVITNEHVVAMMKAAISETEPIPLFEPKMTRSKLKEVVEKGVVIPTWNISPIKQPLETKKGPQFVDISLEEEDSSDEEYQPDEEEEDETAEETLQESDWENSLSSPRVSRVSSHRSLSECEEDSASSRLILQRPRHLIVAATPMGPPPPPNPSRLPQDCSFLEKLHAVDEELAIGQNCVESYQGLSGANGEESLISFRTRSKRPLRDVPLGRLEAELRAPDITPDMYEIGSAPEDREWTQWLQGLMTSDMDNDEEGDDEDDPEYNFLADIDEPDVEDYRNDKAVRITKKEVNELMEELFDTFQDELGVQEEDVEEEEREKAGSPSMELASIMENIKCEDPLADILKQRYKTVREQLEAVRKRKALMERAGLPVPSACPQEPWSQVTALTLNSAQKLQLQQQIQQHVQLLTEVNMLSTAVKGLETEASTTRQFLLELQVFAQHGENNSGKREPGWTSTFKACNLQGAISLLEELDKTQMEEAKKPSPHFPGCQIPAPLAWVMVTRPVFLYPELLPTVPLRPFKFKSQFTSAEDCLTVLGHKHLRGTLNPLQMTCRYLLAARNFLSLKPHIRDVCHKPFPNVIKTYFVTGKCPSMPLACKPVSPCDQRPSVERERSLLPDWLLKNLKRIDEHVRMFNRSSADTGRLGPEASSICPAGTRYPSSLPEGLAQALESLASNISPKGATHKPLKPPLFDKNFKVTQLPNILPKTVPISESEQKIKSLKRVLILPDGLAICPERCNHEDVTLPTVTAASSSLKALPVQNAVETPMGSSPQGPNAKQKDFVITLPATITPEISSYQSRPISVNQTAQIARCTVEPVISTASNIYVNFQPTTFANLLICPAPVVSLKKCARQRSSHLRKIVPKSFSGQNTSDCAILPSANTFSSSLHHSKSSKKNTGKQSSAQKCNNQKLRRQQKVPQHTDVQQGSSLQSLPVFSTPDQLLTTSEEELYDDDGVMNENECAYDERDIIELSLTLSESSGSPAPSVDEEGADMEMEELEQQNVEMEGHLRDVGEKKTETCMNVPFIAELQETINKFLHLGTKAVSEKEGVSNDEPLHQHSGTLQYEESTIKMSSIKMNDPHQDAKDIAFAQAYLEKVCAVLHSVPDKLQQFLSLLSDFAIEPNCHNSVELLKKLKPVLEDWPELLQDFAAFLHPDQARECGLLAEQQAFEHSRQFLQQLESTFGEQSNLYRKVVHILQGASTHDLSVFEEMKAELTLLFRDHADLLEQFWEFYKQLCPQMQVEVNAKNAKTNRGTEGCQTVSSVIVDEEIEQTNADFQCRRKKYKLTEVEKDGKSASADRKNLLFNSAGSSVCAKNISHTPAGKKVVLWTREADRIILTTCQQRGAKATTFQDIATQLGNKSANEVSERFQDLISLFHKSSMFHHTQEN